jgi:hypothetical protein
MRGVVVWLVAILALVAGCANEPHVSLDTFDLRVGDRTTQVHLPGTVDREWLGHPASFVLTAHVVLPVWLHNRDAAVIVPGLLGFDGMRIDGVPAQPLDDDFTTSATVIPHAFTIPAAQTAKGYVDLELHFAYVSITAGHFMSAPRIAAGARGDGRYQWTRAINSDGGWAAVFMLLAIGLVHGIVFVLDRTRRLQAWFALFAIGAALLVILYSRGAQWLGGHSHSAAWTIAFLTGWCGLRYQLAYFEWEPRKWVAIAPLYLIVPWGLFHDPFTAPLNHQRIVGLYSIILLGYIFAVDLRAVRHRRHAAWPQGLSIFTFNLLTVVDIIAAMHIRELAGGVRLLGLAYVTLAIFNSVILAVDHRRHLADLAGANLELRRQIAERSRELSEALANMSSGKTKLVAGDVIDDRYRVIKKLGERGMGAVYEVERIRDHAHFAMKMLLDTSKSSALARFAREGQIAAEIAHPNVLGVVDVGTSQQGLFVVTELVDSGSLEEFRQRFGDRAWAVPVLKQIAAGVAALHGAGVVHRDLKPGNVLLGSDGRPRIADFGIAALRDNKVDVLAATRDQLTAAGALLGTPIYMAPELARGAENASVASDVFAFGVLAYEMLTGKLPFATPPVLDALVGRTSDAPRPSGDATIDKFVMDALALDPKKRPSLDSLTA